MADAKISALTALTTPADGDLVPVVDISDTTDAAEGTTKRVTVAALATAVAASVPTGIPGLDTYVLHFENPTTEHQHVDHGNFWRQPDEDGLDLGTGFFWGAWMAPTTATNSGYLIADGGSGGHALLWGLAGNNHPSGNLWNGSINTSFGGVYEIAVDEWVYYAVTWDGTNITTWINGVRDQSMPFTGPRKTLPASFGRSSLYVGGSNHSNIAMKLAFIQGWDNVLPSNPWWVYQNKQAFCPPRWPWLVDRVGLECDAAWDYTQPTLGPIPDLSPRGYSPTGVAADRRFHHGILDNGMDVTLGGGNLGGGPGGPAVLGPNPGPRPHWELDPTCPFGRDWGTPASLGETIPAPASVPVGAKIFDSFGRANQTWASHLAPTLGSTEGGSLGPKTWITRNTWGILGGAAVPLGGGEQGAFPAAIVMNDSADMTVEIRCPIVPGSTNHTTKTSPFGQDIVYLLIRAVDTANYWYVRYSWDSRTLIVGTCTSSATTRVGDPVQGTALGAVLKATFIGTTLTVYFDGAQVHQLTGQTTYQTATGAGFGSGETSAQADSGCRYEYIAVS